MKNRIVLLKGVFLLGCILFGKVLKSHPSVVETDGHKSWYLSAAETVIEAELLSDQLICSDDEIRVKVVPGEAMNVGDTCYLQLSDSAGSFAGALNLDTIYIGETDTLVGIVPDTLPQGDGYKLRVWASSENVGTASMDISFFKRPDYEYAVDSLVCFGEPALIECLGEPSDSFSFYFHSIDDGVIQEHTWTQQKIVWGSSGSQTVVFSALENGCYSEDTFTYVVEVNPELEVAVSLGVSYCQGDTSSVMSVGDFYEGADYHWELDGGTRLNPENDTLLSVVWDSIGMKKVSLSVELHGCMSDTVSQSIQGFAYPEVSYSLQDSVCEGDTVIISVDGPLSSGVNIFWEIPSAEITSNQGDTLLSVVWTSYDSTGVTLYASQTGCTKAFEKEAMIKLKPVLAFDSDSSICYGMEYEISYTGDSPGDITWDFGDASVDSGEGAGPYSLSWDTSGVQVIDFSIDNMGCVADTSISVLVGSEIEIPSICLVTVDEEESENKLVWLVSQESITEYGIYKETDVEDEYVLLEYVSNDTALLEYVDTASTPSQNPSRYRITAVDSCGEESELSEWHRTIHLTINKGLDNDWNLIWNDYEGNEAGFYHIYRSVDGGEMESLETISGHLTSYTDEDVPEGELAYQIRVLLTPTCIGADGETEYYDPFIRSNIVQTLVDGRELPQKAFSIYPNPTSSIVNVKPMMETGFYELTTVDGKLLRAGNFAGDFALDLTDLTGGLYLLRINGDAGVGVQQIVKR